MSQDVAFGKNLGNSWKEFHPKRLPPCQLQIKLEDTNEKRKELPGTSVLPLKSHQAET
jgi:hypothetical protein